MRLLVFLYSLQPQQPPQQSSEEPGGQAEDEDGTESVGDQHEAQSVEMVSNASHTVMVCVRQDSCCGGLASYLPRCWLFAPPRYHPHIGNTE